MSLGVYSLSELKKGVRAKIFSIESGGTFSLRYLEMGFLEGACVEIAHEAPWSRDPIAVRVRGALIALRRCEASRIKVVICENS